MAHSRSTLYWKFIFIAEKFTAVVQLCTWQAFHQKRSWTFSFIHKILSLTCLDAFSPQGKPENL